MQKVVSEKMESKIMNGDLFKEKKKRVLEDIEDLKVFFFFKKSRGKLKFM